MATLDSNFIISPPLQEVFRDKDTGLPLRNGRVEFFRDTNRIEGKDVFKLDGTPGNYTYTSLGDVVTLTQNGTWGDGLGNDIALAYFPFLDVEGVEEVDRYFIRVFSEDNVEQFTRQAWPRIGEEGEDDDNFINYIADGQFWNHKNFPNGGLVIPPRTQITYGGGLNTEGNNISNWEITVTPGSTSVNNIVFERFGSFITNPPSNPRYAARFSCSSVDLTDQEKTLTYRIKNVNFRASDTEFLTFDFYANNNLSGSVDVKLFIDKNYGSGGSAEESFEIITFTITEGYAQYSVNFVMQDNEGNNLGAADDDLLSLVLTFPPDLIFDVSVTDVILRDGSFVSLLYPEKTLIQNQSDTLSMPVPAHDLSDEGKVPVLIESGFAYQSLVSTLPLRGVLTGLTVENDVTDLTKNIKFDAGIAASVNGIEIDLNAPLVKFLNAPWVPGDSMGGLFSGVIAGNTTYHMFVIKDVVNNLVDCGFDTDPNAANRPAAYTEYERVGSIYTDGVPDIVRFFQPKTYPDKFLLENITSQFTLGLGLGAVIEILPVPTGILFEAFGNTSLSTVAGVGANVLVSSVFQNDVLPTASLSTIKIPGGSPDDNSTQYSIITNTLGQIRYRSSAVCAVCTIAFTVEGWIDNRGKI